MCLHNLNMSMLAEPRRKQKVINLRAKNNAWSNDSNKFGQRMLEKMGWSAGKGLGANENGIVEHVVARYKNDEKGLGFEDRSDQWTKHEDDFNSLLANLSNADNNTEILHSGVSLEKKSKTSKARIHYHKFTRGKDLSRYSEKDLANIFGKKSFKEPEVEEIMKEDTIKATEQVFTEKGNMDDYFKTKMAAFKSKSKLHSTDRVSRDLVSDYAFQGFSNSTETEKEGEQNGSGYQPYSFYGSQNEDQSQVELCLDGETKSKRKKKSKRKEETSEDLVENYITECAQKVMQNVVTDEQTKVKKSKKKNLQKCTENMVSLVEKGENLLACSPETTEIVTADVEQSKVKKSKKKKRQECLSNMQTLEIKENSSVSSKEVIQDESSKKSKKKKVLDLVLEEIQACEIKRKKKNKNRVNDNIQKNVCMEDEVPKKKKKRKNHVL